MLFFQSELSRAENFKFRRLVDWHIANLEYANATSINELSMKNWDQVWRPRSILGVMQV